LRADSGRECYVEAAPLRRTFLPGVSRIRMIEWKRQVLGLPLISLRADSGHFCNAKLKFARSPRNKERNRNENCLYHYGKNGRLRAGIAVLKQRRLERLS
jgi:hypothetical protein